SKIRRMERNTRLVSQSLMLRGTTKVRTAESSVPTIIATPARKATACAATVRNMDGAFSKTTEDMFGWAIPQSDQGRDERRDIAATPRPHHRAGCGPVYAAKGATDPARRGSARKRGWRSAPHAQAPPPAPPCGR